MPTTSYDEIAAAAELLASRAVGVDWAYDLLDDVCARHHLTDAWMVLHPEPSRPQVFVPGRRQLPAHELRAIAALPTGIYDGSHGSRGSLGPHGSFGEATRAALAVLCETTFRAHSAMATSALDEATGLASRDAIEASIARAAACGARYGWSSTVVLLASGGDAPLEERRRALATAVGAVLRSGDEAGVVAPGTALAVLGNAGPDAVRPFVARVRAALSAAGRDDVDLHVATASTPKESVDPAELQRLARERLAEIGAPAPTAEGDESGLELSLRLLPGVVSVAFPGPARHVSVTSIGAPDGLVGRVTRLVHEQFADASVSVADAGAEAPAHPTTTPPAAAANPHVNGSKTGTAAAQGRPPDEHGAVDAPDRAPPLLSAMAPGGRASRGANGATARVSLLGASFDPARGMTEVTLGIGSARGVGRAPAGPRVGGAQATLTALAALGMEVPYYLVSAERAQGVPGEPVVVVLAPHQGVGDQSSGTDERIGVAAGKGDADAASRATLGALNRHLSRPASGA